MTIDPINLSEYYPLEGFSLSQCIRDIIVHDIPWDSVSQITTGTKAHTEEDYQQVLESYSKLYWCFKEPEKNTNALAAAKWFWEKGRIIQPRTEGGVAPWILKYHWKDCYGNPLRF